MPKKLQEVAKYDWVPGQEGKHLIYLNRKPSKEDPGISRTITNGGSEDVLCRLLNKDMLTGQAFKDAMQVCQGVLPLPKNKMSNIG